MSKSDGSNLRATDEEDDEKIDLLDTGHLKSEDQRDGQQDQCQIGDDVRDCGGNIQASAADTCSLRDTHVPAFLNGIASENQSEWNGNAVGHHNTGDNMEPPIVDWLFLHNATIKEDETHFGECEGRNIYDGGSKGAL